MNKIGMIVPKDLVKTATEAMNDSGVEITLLEGSMDEGVRMVNDLEDSPYEVLIARGGTDELLKKSGIEIPIVTIPITPTDILRAMKTGEKKGSKIALIAFQNMMPAIKGYEEVMEYEIEKCVVESSKEVEEKIAMFAAEGFDTIIGGGIVGDLGTKYGVNTIVINTGKDVILRSILEAKRLAAAMREEKEKGEKFRTVVEYAYDGIISIDRDGRINVLNPSAENLLRKKNPRLIGKNIQEVFPQIDLVDTLNRGVEETEVIKNIHGSPFIFSKIPIHVEKETIGAIAIFQDTGKIQRMEEKIRRESVKTGHFARYIFDNIQSVSDVMRESIQIAKEYAKTHSTVLIEGETGTGKEIVAQSIHNASRRAHDPFVAVNCAALPESLLESELFGYVPGAFTGADRKGKKGIFELAHGGTIFLDEISEIHPRLQGRLLRVIQEKQVMRIGDNRVIPIDVRIIAATNRNLEQLVEEGHFREDLYYRLNVLRLLLPSLRERREDIPLLLEHFLQQYSERMGKEKICMEKDALETLCQYPWKGNVRELKNFAERLVVMEQKTTIQESDLKERFLGRGNKPQKVKQEVQLANVEKNTIEQVLLQHGGNISKAAVMLGTSRTTLWRKLKKYGINVSK
ncbi:MAG: proprionate catabolism activator, Fis family [Anaerosolibacter sp.]|jgi:PAS domain S-box-containing protein|uniref:sigma-54-dependent Fis family transcriptional regulator n=1 Tax=Anaerosolibacter sp. TaxID=1872527 RepID=UPI00260349C9|nr:sigma-54-dependent Fis family transcriptional regulator [Anaerosolibacter sp.]MDF2547402.1 proprionate catabolism activator, Fis family [Anaerosolibacter sp.]